MDTVHFRRMPSRQPHRAYVTQEAHQHAVDECAEVARTRIGKLGAHHIRRVILCLGQRGQERSGRLTKRLQPCLPENVGVVSTELPDKHATHL